jgi:hypothetical protein
MVSHPTLPLSQRTSDISVCDVRFKSLRFDTAKQRHPNTCQLFRQKATEPCRCLIMGVTKETDSAEQVAGRPGPLLCVHPARIGTLTHTYRGCIHTDLFANT